MPEPASPSSASRPEPATAAQETSSGIHTSASRSATRWAAGRPSTTTVSSATQSAPRSSVGSSRSSTGANDEEVTTRRLRSQDGPPAPAVCPPEPPASMATAVDAVATTTSTATATHSAVRRGETPCCGPGGLPKPCVGWSDRCLPMSPPSRLRWRTGA